MKKIVDVVRAWKDAGYRETLTAEEQSLVPTSPAGMMELTDEDLEFVVGGLAEQTGTGGVGCSCILSKTANSGAGGECWCVCDEQSIKPDEAPRG